MDFLGIGGLLLGLSISMFAVGFFNQERNWGAYICLILFSAVAGGIYYFSIGVIGITFSKFSQLLGFVGIAVAIAQCWNFVIGPFKVIQRTKLISAENPRHPDVEEALNQNST